MAARKETGRRVGAGPGLWAAGASWAGYYPTAEPCGPSAAAPQALAPGSHPLVWEPAASRHETEHGDPAVSPGEEQAVTLWAQLWVP